MDCGARFSVLETNDGKLFAKSTSCVVFLLTMPHVLSEALQSFAKFKIAIFIGTECGVNQCLKAFLKREFRVTRRTADG